MILCYPELVAGVGPYDGNRVYSLIIDLNFKPDLNFQPDLSLQSFRGPNSSGGCPSHFASTLVEHMVSNGSLSKHIENVLIARQIKFHVLNTLLIAIQHIYTATPGGLPPIMLDAAAAAASKDCTFTGF